MQDFELFSTPFRLLSDNDVIVEGGQGPYENTRRALRGVDLSPACGRRVMLKPNVGRLAKAGEAVTTEPQVVAAAIDAFVEAGAEVCIAESPIVGVKTLEAFEVSGIAEVARERSIELIDLDARPPVDVAVREGLAIDRLRVCAEVTEVDWVVSIPVMKMHMHTGVTLSVKNMKGCLWRRSKVQLHMLPPVEGVDEKSINVAIVDMAKHLTPHLAIIDGTAGMQGLGPSAGTARTLDTVVVGADAYAADAVACGLMGTAAGEVPHLYMAAARGYGEIDLSRLRVSPQNWRDRAQDFERPPADLDISFPGTHIHDRNSCSACQSTLLLFLKRFGDQLFDYFPKDRNVNIAIGKGHESLPEGTLCIGNCTVAHRDCGIFVKGCPPVGSEIQQAIAEHTQKKQAGS